MCCVPLLLAVCHSSEGSGGREILEPKIRGRFQSIYNWFVSDGTDENEASRLFDETNEIIRKITRYAARITEKNASGANRREEYRKVAELFLRCNDLNEAHKMSAMVFGMERPLHLKGEQVRETDSMNQGVYEEKPMMLTIKPRVRTYREKTNRSAIRESAEQKKKARQEMIGSPLPVFLPPAIALLTNYHSRSRLTYSHSI